MSTGSYPVVTPIGYAEMEISRLREKLGQVRETLRQATLMLEAVCPGQEALIESCWKAAGGKPTPPEA